MGYQIAVVVGSLRKASFNRQLAHAVTSLAPPDFSFDFVDIGVLPLYNQEYDVDFPEVARKFKQQIEAADALLFVTAEYNRSVPGVLKNMIDYTSRPYGDNAWDQKPVYVVGASIGGVGTAAAQGELKKVMLYLNARVLGQPEFYGSGVQEKLDADGRLADEKTLELVARGTAAFTAFIEQLR